MNHLPLISVIVPIYKVEPYLRKCVDSILAQTYKNLEVILVDDGSPDGCPAICDEYAAKDSRVKVIHKQNGGLSDARNAGMAIMTGELVGFVDSSDWIEPQMYQRLYELMDHYGADMAFGGVADDLEENGHVTTAKTSDYGENPFSEDNRSAMRRYFHGSWSAWDKLYRAELFYDIRYPVGEINEDEAIVLHLLNRCKKVCYTNEVFYHYMKRTGSGSITASNFSEKKLAWVDHCKANLNFIQEKYPQLELDAAVRYRSSLLWALREIALSEQTFSAAQKELRKQLRDNCALFSKAPFKEKRDWARYLMMTYLPFGVNRAVLRLRHKV